MKKPSARIFFSACVIVALLVGLSTFSQVRGERDSRGCPTESAPDAVIAILLDASDALTSSDERRLKLIEDDVLKNSAPNTLVMIAALRDDEKEPVEWGGAMCVSPEAPLSESPMDYLYSNPRQQRRNWNKSVRDRFRKLLSEGMSSATPQRGSPISEALFVMARAPEFSSSASRRLLVVSDMLESTPRFSIYNRTGRGVRAALDRRPEWNGALEGTDVVVFRVHRQDTNLQNMLRFRRYWSEYSARTDAQSWRWH